MDSQYNFTGIESVSNILWTESKALEILDFDQFYCLSDLQQKPEIETTQDALTVQMVVKPHHATGLENL